MIKRLIEKCLFKEYPGILDIKNYKVEKQSFMNLAYILDHQKPYSSRDIENLAKGAGTQVPSVMMFVHSSIPMYLLFFFKGVMYRTDRSFVSMYPVSRGYQTVEEAKEEEKHYKAELVIKSSTPFLFPSFDETDKRDSDPFVPVYTGWRVRLIQWFLQLQIRRHKYWRENFYNLHTYQDSRDYWKLDPMIYRKVTVENIVPLKEKDIKE